MALKTLQNDQLVVNWSLPQIDDASDEGSTSACSTCWQVSTRRWTRWVGAHAHAHHTVAHDVAEVGLDAEEDDPVADASAKGRPSSACCRRSACCPLRAVHVVVDPRRLSRRCNRHQMARMSRFESR